MTKISLTTPYETDTTTKYMLARYEAQLEHIENIKHNKEPITSQTIFDTIDIIEDPKNYNLTTDIKLKEKSNFNILANFTINKKNIHIADFLEDIADTYERVKQGGIIKDCVKLKHIRKIETSVKNKQKIILEKHNLQKENLKELKKINKKDYDFIIDSDLLLYNIFASILSHIQETIILMYISNIVLDSTLYNSLFALHQYIAEKHPEAKGKFYTIKKNSNTYTGKMLFSKTDYKKYLQQLFNNTKNNNNDDFITFDILNMIEITLLANLLYLAGKNIDTKQLKTNTIDFINSIKNKNNITTEQAIANFFNTDLFYNINKQSLFFEILFNLHTYIINNNKENTDEELQKTNTILTLEETITNKNRTQAIITSKPFFETDKALKQTALLPKIIKELPETIKTEADKMAGYINYIAPNDKAFLELKKQFALIKNNHPEKKNSDILQEIAPPHLQQTFDLIISIADTTPFPLENDKYIFSTTKYKNIEYFSSNYKDTSVLLPTQYFDFLVFKNTEIQKLFYFIVNYYKQKQREIKKNNNRLTFATIDYKDYRLIKTHTKRIADDLHSLLTPFAMLKIELREKKGDTTFTRQLNICNIDKIEKETSGTYTLILDPQFTEWLDTIFTKKEYIDIDITFNDLSYKAQAILTDLIRLERIRENKNKHQKNYTNNIYTHNCNMEYILKILKDNNLYTKKDKGRPANLINNIEKVLNELESNNFISYETAAFTNYKNSNIKNYTQHFLETPITIKLLPTKIYYKLNTKIDIKGTEIDIKGTEIDIRGTENPIF